MFKHTYEVKNLYFYRKCWLETMIYALKVYKETGDETFLNWAKTFGEYSKRDKERINELSTIR